MVLATGDSELNRAQAWPVTLVSEALAQSILLVVAPRGERELDRQPAVLHVRPFTGRD